MAPPSKNFKYLILPLFFASGISGLVYEVIWARMLHITLGCTLYAVTLVLSAFMAGLALGSYGIGKLIESQTTDLKLYALIEAGIGLFALCSPWFLSLLDPLYVRLYGPLREMPFLLNTVRFFLAFLILLIPSALMGATLPVLIKYVVEKKSSLGMNTGLLYGINTIGATAGSFCTGFLFIHMAGLRLTIYLAAILNLLVAALAWFIYKSQSPPSKTTHQNDPAGSRDKKTASVATDPRIIAALVVFGFSGFASLGYEVIWTRSIGFFIGNTTYAFSAMLTTFLLGIGLGSLVAARYSDRLKRPFMSYGLLEMLIGFSAIASILILVKFSGDFSYENNSSTPGWYKFFLSFSIMIFPTILIGALFPVVCRICTSALERAGKSIGIIYAVNTIGCIFGASITGFLLLPWLGIQKSIVLIAITQVVIGTGLVYFCPQTILAHKAARVAPVIILLLIVLSNLPDQGHLFTSVGRNGMPKDALTMYYKEGATHIVEVLETPAGNRVLVINGSINAAPLPVSVGVRTHRMLSQLPLLLHHDPRSILMIGFGAGMTAASPLVVPGVNKIDCAEISRDVLFAEEFFSYWNRDVIHHYDFNLLLEDGRNIVLASPAKYDVITTGIIHPKWDAGNASLYSTDFYRLCRKRLNPGGIVSQWAPLNGLSPEEFKIILRSFQQIFPHCSLWFAQTFGYLAASNAILLGSDQPLAIDGAKLAELFKQTNLKEDLFISGIENPEELLNCFVLGENRIKQYTSTSDVVNSDDFPVLESGPVKMYFKEIMEELAPLREPVEPYVNSMHSDSLKNLFVSSNLCIQGDIAFLEHDYNHAIAFYGQAHLMDPENKDIFEEFIQGFAQGNIYLLEKIAKVQGWSPENVKRFLSIMFHLDDTEGLLWTSEKFRGAGWLDAGETLRNVARKHSRPGMTRVY